MGGGVVEGGNEWDVRGCCLFVFNCKNRLVECSPLPSLRDRELQESIYYNYNNNQKMLTGYHRNYHPHMYKNQTLTLSPPTRQFPEPTLTLSPSAGDAPAVLNSNSGGRFSNNSKTEQKLMEHIKNRDMRGIEKSIAYGARLVTTLTT